MLEEPIELVEAFPDTSCVSGKTDEHTMSEVFRLNATNALLLVYEDRVVVSRNTIGGYISLGGAMGDRTYYSAL